MVQGHEILRLATTGIMIVRIRAAVFYAWMYSGDPLFFMAVRIDSRLCAHYAGFAI